MSAGLGGPSRDPRRW